MAGQRTIPLVHAPGCNHARTRAGESTYVRALQLACFILGGLEPMARHLQVAPAELKLWLDAKQDPPERVFLATVEVLLLDAEKGLRAS